MHAELDTPWVRGQVVLCSGMPNDSLAMPYMSTCVGKCLSYGLISIAHGIGIGIVGALLMGYVAAMSEWVMSNEFEDDICRILVAEECRVLDCSPHGPWFIV